MTSLLLLALQLTAEPLSSGAVRPPQLVVEAPPELTAVARRIEQYDPQRLLAIMRLTGMQDPGPPIRVILASEGSNAAAQVPPWVAGFAIGTESLIVLFPARAPTYPTDSLEELLHHEVAHVIVARAAGGRPVPRWFNEGVAMAAEGAWGFEDRTRFAWALVTVSDLTLEEIDALFWQSRRDGMRGYALAGAFVRHLLQRYGPEMPGRVLANVAAGFAFDEAFFRATGEFPSTALGQFWRHQAFWTRWIPLLTSSTLLWFSVSLLALYAFKKRRDRSAARRRQWEEEERQLYGERPDDIEWHDGRIH